MAADYVLLRRLATGKAARWRVDQDGCWPLGGLIEAVFECELIPQLPPDSAGHAAGVMFRWREKEREQRPGRQAA